MISGMKPYVIQRTHRKTFCWECEILEQRLNAATDSIVDILDKRFISEDEKSQRLDEALDVRHHLLENYLEHLDDHRPAAAA